VQEYFAVLKQVSPQQLDAIAQEVFDEYKDQTYIYTRNLFKKLQGEGYFMLAISGSHDEIIQKMARYYGFDAAMGAMHEKVGGKFSGNVGYSPVFDKREALERLIKKHGLTAKGSYGVGDSKSDAPILEMVDNPIVFNPDKKLFDIAAKQQWKVVVERKNMVYQLEPRQGRYVLTAT
jgi:HAD superfamily hydrolase (TIGR01490 family)